ncbi:hypothetical protein [Ancylobacter lacus]|uniref:hypothetical protein n=1 Tax=Ancylobacter lacus TaxID=2579970 RepID=UPI001BCF1689|nr:hypothetical protein [Ancylobacter lacus]MBS7541241.1 hypothetical protein [Ancylobacter lacus]
MDLWWSAAAAAAILVIMLPIGEWVRRRRTQAAGIAARAQARPAAAEGWWTLQLELENQTDARWDVLAVEVVEPDEARLIPRRAALAARPDEHAGASLFSEADVDILPRRSSDPIAIPPASGRGPSKTAQRDRTVLETYLLFAPPSDTTRRLDLRLSMRSAAVGERSIRVSGRLSPDQRPDWH